MAFSTGIAESFIKQADWLERSIASRPAWRPESSTALVPHNGVSSDTTAPSSTPDEAASARTDVLLSPSRASDMVRRAVIQDSQPPLSAELLNLLHALDESPAARAALVASRPELRHTLSHIRAVTPLLDAAAAARDGGAALAIKDLYNVDAGSAPPLHHHAVYTPALSAVQSTLDAPVSSEAPFIAVTSEATPAAPAELHVATSHANGSTSAASGTAAQPSLPLGARSSASAPVDEAVLRRLDVSIAAVRTKSVSGTPTGSASASPARAATSDAGSVYLQSYAAPRVVDVDHHPGGEAPLPSGSTHLPVSPDAFDVLAAHVAGTVPATATRDEARELRSQARAALLLADEMLKRETAVYASNVAAELMPALVSAHSKSNSGSSPSASPRVSPGFVASVASSDAQFLNHSTRAELRRVQALLQEERRQAAWQTVLGQAAPPETDEPHEVQALTDTVTAPMMPASALEMVAAAGVEDEDSIVFASQPTLMTQYSQRLDAIEREAVAALSILEASTAAATHSATHAAATTPEHVPATAEDVTAAGEDARAQPVDGVAGTPMERRFRRWKARQAPSEPTATTSPRRTPEGKSPAAVNSSIQEAHRLHGPRHVAPLLQQGYVKPANRVAAPASPPSALVSVDTLRVANAVLSPMDSRTRGLVPSPRREPKEQSPRSAAAAAMGSTHVSAKQPVFTGSYRGADASPPLTVDGIMTHGLPANGLAFGMIAPQGPSSPGSNLVDAALEAAARAAVEEATVRSPRSPMARPTYEDTPRLASPSEQPRDTSALRAAVEAATEIAPPSEAASAATPGRGSMESSDGPRQDRSRGIMRSPLRMTAAVETAKPTMLSAVKPLPAPDLSEFIAEVVAADAEAASPKHTAPVPAEVAAEESVGELPEEEEDAEPQPAPYRAPIMGSMSTAPALPAMATRDKPQRRGHGYEDPRVSRMETAASPKRAVPVEQPLRSPGASAPDGMAALPTLIAAAAASHVAMAANTRAVASSAAFAAAGGPLASSHAAPHVPSLAQRGNNTLTELLADIVDIQHVSASARAHAYGRSTAASARSAAVAHDVSSPAGRKTMRDALGDILTPLSSSKRVA